MNVLNTYTKIPDDFDIFISNYMQSGSSKQGFFEICVLYSISKNLNLSIKLDNYFAKGIVALKDAFQMDGFCLMLLDDEAKELKALKIDAMETELIKDIAVNMGEGISEVVAFTGEPIVIQDVRNDKRFSFCKNASIESGSFMSIPLKLDDGKVTGVLNIYKKGINAFPKGDVAIFSTIANSIAHTIERLKLYEKVQKQSIHDDLTALYTRGYFLENCYREYNSAIRKEGVFSIILLDIDNFKYFNDTYGHSVGDKVIKTVAHIIKANVRLCDTVSRYGGEEFAVLLPETGKNGATVVAEKIRHTIQDMAIEISIDVFEKVTITAGVASYPDDGIVVEVVIDKADEYLLLGKNTGRNKVVSVKTGLLLNKEEEKRLQRRCRAGLKVTESVDFPQYLEINLDGEGWKLCNVIDISKMGINGLSDYEVKAGSMYECRVVFNALDKAYSVFQVKVVYVMEMNSNRYRFGAKIIDDLQNWQKLFTFLSR